MTEDIPHPVFVVGIDLNLFLHACPSTSEEHSESVAENAAVAFLTGAVVTREDASEVATVPVLIVLFVGHFTNST